MTLRGGIDLGGTKILAVVVDEAHRVRGSCLRPTPATGGPARVAAAMADALTAAATAAHVAPSGLLGVGVGSPGVVDVKRGTVSHAGNVAGWTRLFPLGPTLAKVFGAPVILGNDVGCAVDAEAALGAGRGRPSMLGVWWGTGIGGGVVLDGRRWQGRGAAGEIGHTIVVRGGALCPCGNRGCLEAYAGRRALEARARRAVARGEHTKLFRWMEEKKLTRLTSGLWQKGVEKGDPLAVRLVARGERALAAGIASVVNLLDLDTVVIGGGMGSRFGAPLARRLGVAMRPHLFVPERPPRVRTARRSAISPARSARRCRCPALSRPRRTSGRARSCTSLTTSAVQPVWWLAPSPRPVSPSKYSWKRTRSLPVRVGRVARVVAVARPPARRRRAGRAPTRRREISRATSPQVHAARPSPSGTRPCSASP